MGSEQHESKSIANDLLWEEIRQGNKKALAAIFNKYFDSLYGYGYRIVANDQKVRDAIQEVFYQLWKYRERLTEVQSVRAYLFVSLRREILNEKSASVRREKRHEEYSLEEFQIHFKYDKWVEVLDIKKEKKGKVKEAIKGLTPRQREAIFLKYFEGLSTQEMTGVMQVRAQSIYNILSDAIKKLRNILNK
ncbi:RNA polymerase sigma factor [Fodinibius saliphilus]|uniref:RNA polymerase sigma factor n=1 Tax=Fodinibius saliphilus TaxID=1920650 RepID=UPI001107AA44|nr:RNA polymerase sigma factor [Fodinibius saliphilus]